MLISGIHTLTLLDFPDRVSAIVFTPGCNMRCGYCHNSQFVLPEKIKEIAHDFIPEEKFFTFLETRKNFLEGVVVSGGEPTIHPDLPDFIQKIKAMGFLVKLDTNGTNPDVLEQLLSQGLLDYVAMDIKAPKEKYADLTKFEGSFENIQKSRDLILNSGVDYEFRTTVVRGYHTIADIEEISKFCKESKRYTLQNFRPKSVLDPKFKMYTGFSKEDLEKMKHNAEISISEVKILD